MFDHQPGKEAAIQPVESLQGVDGGILGDDSQIQPRVSQGEIEIDQQRALTTLLGQRNCKTAGQRGYAGAALGSHESQQPAACLQTFGASGASRRPARCCTYQRLRHDGRLKRKRKKLACACSRRTSSGPIRATDRLSTPRYSAGWVSRSEEVLLLADLSLMTKGHIP